VAALHQGRLLIFEDDPRVGNMIRMIAAASGFDAHVVTHAERFFAEVDSWQPTHIALDLVMPDMDGVQVLGELGKRGCTAEIIITSGMGSRVLDAAGRSASEHGLRVVGVLAKPFSAAALRALLRARTPGDLSVPSAGRRSDGSPAPHAVTAEELRFALENGQLRVYYQPKISCAHGHLAGFEALVRWQQPQRGLIMPDQFVPFAETHALIDALTEEVLAQALVWFGTRFPDGRPGSGISLSINLSAASLLDGEMVERILGYCRRSAISPERLIFEVTETSAMANPIGALDMLTRMRVQGFELSIDDFGTGYSSMLQLVRMPFSEIKVDKSFVMSALESVESRAVVKSIIDLGRSLGLKSAAEGVEDASTLDLLRDMGCNFAQGYFIGRPMDSEAVDGWITAKGLAAADPKSHPGGAGTT
jgi:EAL domain-containing protein (putative c-di-GMP-specific phosphodiesterase class I)/DNA-binding NarL/FixJ family response regulator